ncbi:MAG: hypothetical protein ACRCTQ_00495 [Brevinemataceae bacterium]
MKLSRFLFILVVIIIYCLLFSAQRIESKEKHLEIASLKYELEVLNARKQELVVLIDEQRQRLINKTRNIGKPLSPKDIVVVE